MFAVCLAVPRNGTDAPDNVSFQWSSIRKVALCLLWECAVKLSETEILMCTQITEPTHSTKNGTFFISEVEQLYTGLGRWTTIQPSDPKFWHYQSRNTADSQNDSLPTQSDSLPSSLWTLCDSGLTIEAPSVFTVELVQVGYLAEPHHQYDIWKYISLSYMYSS